MSSAARQTSSIAVQVVSCGAVLKANRIGHTLQTSGAHMTANAAAIVGGYVVPITAEPIEGGTVLIEDGKIAAVGVDLDIPPDANELTEPVTAHVRALDAINPADLGFRDAVSGGVLAVNVNPGSGNPIGGQTVALKCWGRTVDEMALRAPSGMKSALGENPKRVYGDRGKMPSTRLGTAAVIRGALVAAANYLQRLEA